MTVIDLQTPLRVGGMEMRQLNLRRPKVRDLERMDKAAGDMAKALTLIADLSEIAPDDLREMDAADFIAVSTALSDFLASTPARSGA